MEKISDEIDRKALKRAIVKEYGTQRKFAEDLGITESNLSNKIKTLSNDFILELKSRGIDPRKSGVEYIPDTTKSFIKEPGQPSINDYLKKIELLEAKIERLEYENKILYTKYAALLEANLGIGDKKINKRK